MKTLRSITLPLTLLLLAACSGTGEVEFNEEDSIGDRLYRVTNADVGLAYIDPNADFAQYDKVMLDDLDSSKTAIVQPNSSSGAAGNRPFELTESDQQALAQAYREVFEKELAETGDYEIVSEAGPGVLRIAAALTEMAPSAPKDDNKSRPAGRSRIYTADGAGSMTISFAFGDSQSGEVLAIVKDSRAGNPTGGLNNAVTNMRDVRLIFARWARMLRARLDIAHGY